jgi:hypothetical protein
MTKEQFKKRWESNEDGGGITYDDVADCATEWGIFSRPRIREPEEVLAKVLAAAGITSM